ncbi:30S ribosomal protein S7 [Patescibacteria group bacterium]|nr:30S ribosomal protein S7 [Patescibacteria group bacterium]MBU4512687.1 30S ribosomal protein S7 [Patescibacteria group bacterium]MCG2693589.1 30S ribosomal protein S7 [Candidatus Parcubacteria bacterium]
MRGKPAPKRKIKSDPKHNSATVAKFINHIMQRGKKTVAQKIVYGAFDLIAQKTKKDPLDIFKKALENISPEVEVRGRRIGGANYQIPMEVNPDRRMTLGMRWILTAARARKGKPMAERLAMELQDAAQNQGAAFKKKQDTYRMAQANKAFAHFGRPRRKK